MDPQPRGSILRFLNSCDSAGDDAGGIRDNFSRGHGCSEIFGNVGWGWDLDFGLLGGHSLV